MWADSPFARPVSSFVSPVPVPGTESLSGDCYIIRINGAWLPYIRGALQQLLLQTTWDTDADGLNKVQLQAFDLINAFNTLEPGGCAPFTLPTITAESEYEMSLCEQLRFQDGKLQALCCGVWTDIQGQGSQGNPVSGQPGNGTPQPQPGGGCQDYDGIVIGNQQWLVPTSVSTGDQITLLSSDGAFGEGLYWTCPNGLRFWLGQCYPFTERYDSTSQLPSAPLGSLIVHVGSDYYALGSTGVATIGSGHLNEQVTLEVNTPAGTQVTGQSAVKIQVCNNQAASWTHTIALSGSQALLTPYNDPLWGRRGVWTGGAGWQGQSGAPVSGAYYSGLELETVFGGPINITDLAIQYSLAKGTFGGGLGTVHNEIVLYNGSTVVASQAVTSSTDPDGTGKTLVVAHGAYTVTRVYIQIVDAYYNSGSPGSDTITELVVSGTGTDPYAGL